MAQDNKSDKIYNTLKTIISNNISEIINVSSKVKINENIISNTNPSSLNQNNNNKKSSESLIITIKLFIESIPQSFLLICVLILFILFFIVIIIILICLIKKRKKLQTETIVNNNKIDINKMILRNSNLKGFQQIQNDSNILDNSNGANNMSLSEIKEKNLKEEIHSIVSGTLSKMIINKSKKLKKKKKGKVLKNGKGSPKSENKNIINTDKELIEESQKNKINNLVI